MARFLAWLLSAVTWLLVTGSVVVISGGLLGRPLLVAAVPTGSMAPALEPGDLIPVVPLWAWGSPVPGEIIVFRTPAHPNWVVHRIVAGDAHAGYVTRGDANPGRDPEPVLLADIAGVVPAGRGGALRLRHLGALSMERTPLSDPLVTVLALGLGVYLVLTDVPRPWRRCPRLRRPGRRPTGRFLVRSYGLMAGAAFLLTLMPAWVLSGAGRVEYEVVTALPAHVTSSHRVLTGSRRVQEHTLRNPVPIPLAVVFTAGDPALEFAPRWALVPPGGSVTVRSVVHGGAPGHYVAHVHQGVYLPLLPLPLLAWLSGLTPLLAATACALLPAGAVLALAAGDLRFRIRVRAHWLRLASRWSW